MRGSIQSAEGLNRTKDWPPRSKRKSSSRGLWTSSATSALPVSIADHLWTETVITFWASNLPAVSIRFRTHKSIFFFLLIYQRTCALAKERKTEGERTPQWSGHNTFTSVSSFCQDLEHTHFLSHRYWFELAVCLVPAPLILGHWPAHRISLYMYTWPISFLSLENTD